LKHESAALALFEIERNAAEAAHMEESFVLDLADAWVMQVAHIHKTTAL